MYNTKKIFLTSCFAMTVVCSALAAVEIDTSGKINGENAMCRIGALGTDSTDGGSVVKFKARWEINTYTCPVGQYYDHLLAACTQCPANSYCPGGEYEYDPDEDQGIKSCPSDKLSKTYSAAGSSEEWMCYTGQMRQDCDRFNPVEGASNVSYANTTTTVTSYVDGTTSTDTIGACEIISLTCDTGSGYVKNPSTNGALANYVGQKTKISYANTKWRAKDDSNNSDTALGYGSPSGLALGTGEFAWTNGTTVHYRTSCNTTSKYVGDTMPNSSFNTSSTGKYCWCNMDSYKLSGSSPVSVADSVWKAIAEDKDAAECASTCAYECYTFLLNDGESELFGEYGEQMACVKTTPSYTCAPGTYLPANATACVTCPAGSYCEGGTFDFNSDKAQGIEECNQSIPNSAAGTTSEAFCYAIKSMECSEFNKIENGRATYANTNATLITYANGEQSTDPVGACAITSLTCDSGYLKTPNTNGALANYVLQGIPLDGNTDIHYVATDGALQNSSAFNGQGSVTGMANGEYLVTWPDNTSIHGYASCSLNMTTAEYDCNCSLDNYSLLGGNAVTVSPANVILQRSFATLEKCHDSCTKNCATSISVEQSFRAELFGSLGQSVCEEITYTCTPGTYLPANATACVTCTAGNFCEGGTFRFNATEAQGIDTCPTKFPNSAAGTPNPVFCYSSKMVKCAQFNAYTAGHGTATYANTNATLINYNPGGLTTLEDIGACEIISLTCDSGYSATAAGPLANYTLQDIQTAYNTDIHYLAIDGSAEYSSPYNNQGSVTGMTNGEYLVTWPDNTSVHGYASCSLDSTTNKYDCTCSMDSYSLLGGNSVTVSPANTFSTTGGAFATLALCQQNCAYKCVVSYISTNKDNARQELFGSLGAQPVCEESSGTTYTCEPGTYLPANGTACVPCTAGNYCEGGTFTSDSSAHGLSPCPNGYPNSAAGAINQKQCYKTVTVTCSTFNPCDSGNTICSKETGATYDNVSTSAKEYNGSSSDIPVLDTIGACAVTALNCVTGYAMGTAGALHNYALESMVWDYNTNIKYLALDGASATSSSGTGQGATTGMTAGDWEIKWSDNTKVNGTSSCAMNADSTYDCSCELESYSLLGGITVSASSIRPIQDTYASSTQCQNKCTAECATQISQSKEFRVSLFEVLAERPVCQANTITLNWYNQNSLVTSNSCTYDGSVTFPEGPFTRTGYHVTGWQIRQ